MTRAVLFKYRTRFFFGEVKYKILQMEVFNDDENDNKCNNKLPNKHFIMYYWLNIDKHWP
jgi:hypothetical protein